MRSSTQAVVEGGYTMQIQGHRGGFKPDNILPTFQKSLDNNLEAIELDVWLTKDGLIVVCHGGDDGNLKDYGLPEEFIYEWTYERLKTLDAGEGAYLPLLEEVFQLFEGKIFINIEVKGPRTESLKPKYDCDKVVAEVLGLVDKYEMHQKFLISSFNYDVLASAEKAREARKETNPHFDIIYLYNYENQPLPSPDEYLARGNGINISANHINDEVVSQVKSKGLKLGVWIRAKDYTESEETYLQMLNYGIDFICADFPLKAMATRERYFLKVE
ncbi:glycerophosphoryl diester phosphodiesterase [Stylonychia lemnae]|uniref:Glycerophosphoryl diester phosphodiesterase n=1 Tax=Stylonychia lemnae TaxID=5949 RepID=A0A077ZW10_STYLE|nr:glycerophosphoryl diester phosphodiesterase [Stylonychia lemnae]|eukprot:CDW73445.1 glycerophosphoryl diester phosphodiesterase [Stylonychia lemnae]